jgi:hypothetical protein
VVAPVVIGQESLSVLERSSHFRQAAEARRGAVGAGEDICTATVIELPNTLVLSHDVIMPWAVIQNEITFGSPLPLDLPPCRSGPFCDFPLLPDAPTRQIGGRLREVRVRLG